MNDKPTATRRRSRRRRIALGLTLGVTALAAIVGWLIYLSWSEPEHWQANVRYLRETPAPQLDALARDLETQVSAVTNNTIEPTASPPTSQNLELQLPLTQINAWLSQRLPRWLAYWDADMPADVAEPMLATQDESLVAAFAWGSDAQQRIISITARVEPAENDRARLHIDSVRSGRLNIASGMLLNQLIDRVAAYDDRLASALRGEPFAPVWPIDAQRQVRLLNVQPQPDALALTLRIEPRDDAADAAAAPADELAHDPPDTATAPATP